MPAPTSDVRRVVAVGHPPFPVVAHQLGVGLDRVGHVGREQRVAVPGGQLDGVAARGAAVPDADRLLQRPRPGLGLVQGRPEPALPGDLVLPPEPAEQLVALAVAVPLVLGGDVEQLLLRRPVALPDDQLEPPVGEVVEGGVVLERPHGVEQRQRRDAGEQADPARARGDVGEDHRRRRGEERPLVPLADREPVETELLGQHRVLDDAAEPFVRRGCAPGAGVGPVRDQREDEELHADSRAGLS